MLRTSSMEPENDAGRHRLFVTHSFLVALARGVIHTLTPARSSDLSRVLVLQMAGRTEINLTMAGVAFVYDFRRSPPAKQSWSGGVYRTTETDRSSCIGSLLSISNRLQSSEILPAGRFERLTYSREWTNGPWRFWKGQLCPASG